MWLNSRDLSRDDDGVTTRDGVWGFSQSASHGSIGASISRVLQNRMEPAEEEREEEALPSYLSYLQPASRPVSPQPTTLAPSASPSAAISTRKGSTSGLSPLPQHVLVTPEVTQGSYKSSELAHALENLVADSVQRHVRAAPTDKSQSRCTCSCNAVRVQMQEMVIQMQVLQKQVLELTKNTIPTAMEVTRASRSSSWSAEAPPFVPRKQQVQSPTPPLLPLDQCTATVLSDRISTLEGRQSAFQSQLAQIAKVLGIPGGKPGKHRPVKHLVQTLHDKVDAKVQEAQTGLMAEIRTAIGDFAVGDDRKKDTAQHVSMHTVLAALAAEHETSLGRLSGSFEELVADEARQRAALEARVRTQLAQQEEWLQQLEGAFGSRHDLEQGQDLGRQSVNSDHCKFAALERKCQENRDFCQSLAQLLPDAMSTRLLLKPEEEEEEEEERDGLSWLGHMVDHVRLEQ